MQGEKNLRLRENYVTSHVYSVMQSVLPKFHPLAFYQHSYARVVMTVHRLKCKDHGNR